MIERLADAEAECYTVVVVDEPRGSRQEFLAGGEHDPRALAEAVLAEHDTADPRPPGVTVSVYSADGDEVVTVTTTKRRA
jgi:hypothetical protein